MKKELKERINDLRAKIFGLDDGTKKFEMQKKLIRLESFYQDMYFDIE